MSDPEKREPKTKEVSFLGEKTIHFKPSKSLQKYYEKKLIVALDFDSAELALNFLENLDPQKCLVKLD